MKRKKAIFALALVLAAVAAGVSSFFFFKDPYNRTLCFGTAEEQYDAAMKMQEYRDASNKEAAEMRGEGYRYGYRTYPQIARLLDKAAHKGSADAMYELGRLYGDSLWSDYEIEEDAETALGYYMQAAERGRGDAWRSAASICKYDFGDLDKAMEYYQKAADAGDDYALVAIGDIYFDELGDCETGVSYYKQAAERGDIHAMTKLGGIYFDEFHDYAAGISYYKQAAEREDYYAIDAMTKLGDIYSSGEQVQKDEAEAVRYYQMAIEQYQKDADGDDYRLYKMGELYFDKLHDYQTGISYYKQAAERGSILAMWRLAELYSSGEQAQNDDAESERYYRMAIAQYQIRVDRGDDYELEAIADIYFNRLHDYETGISYYKRAAERGYIASMLTLGDIYYEGEYVPRNYAQAIRWYSGVPTENGEWYTERAAQAQYRLGVMYENGRGTRRNYAKARSWYEAAAANGSEDAQAALDRLGG